jgi:hypothetical protein
MSYPLILYELRYVRSSGSDKLGVMEDLVSMRNQYAGHYKLCIVR